MKVKAFSLIVFSVVFLSSCGLGPEYNLSFLPPDNKATPAEIFPAEISGQKAVLQRMKIGGMEARYGQDKAIFTARLKSNEEAKAFLKLKILPEFKKMPVNFSGTVNGQYYAKATGDEKKYYGWVNANFVFVIKGMSEKAFEEIVDNFRYISKK